MLADSGLGGACFAWVKLVIVAGVPFLGWNSLMEQGFVVGVFNDYFPCVNWLGVAIVPAITPAPVRLLAHLKPSACTVFSPHNALSSVGVDCTR